mgnify:CR=1 FL=1
MLEPSAKGIGVPGRQHPPPAQPKAHPQPTAGSCACGAARDPPPAINVQGDDDEACCSGRSQRERETGLLATNEGYRLPTTSEWTRALGQAQAPDSSNFGPQLGIDNFPQTSPVGSFPGNSLGLHDLRGNVWEWCTAWPSEEGIGRILRGGGWRDETPALIAAYRELIVTPKVSAEDYGFRCILVLKRPAGL